MEQNSALITHISRASTDDARGLAALVSADYSASGIRRWASRNGLLVPARGQIPRWILNAYDTDVNERADGWVRWNGVPGPADLRDWANQNGYTVSSRGRVPRSIIGAYEASR